MLGTIYLLHFSAPLGNPATPYGLARHYLGWADDWHARNRAHLAGRGAAITRAALAAGITWECFPLCPGDQRLERALKQRKAGPRLCPICGQSHPRGPLRLHWDQLELPWEFGAFDPPPGPAWGWPGYFAPRCRSFGLADLDTSCCDIPF